MSSKFPGLSMYMYLVWVDNDTMKSKTEMPESINYVRWMLGRGEGCAQNSFYFLVPPIFAAFQLSLTQTETGKLWNN